MTTPTEKPHLTLAPKVTILPVLTNHDVPTERVLNAALAHPAPLQGCVVVGVDADGEMYFASSYADGGNALWWLEKAKKALLEY